MQAASGIIDMLRADPLRWHLLGIVRDLALPDAWIAGGFVRNAVWDRLHGRVPSAPAGDVDVIRYDPDCLDPATDRQQEALLGRAAPGIIWSVKNQARMHRRNGDDPYESATDAMRCWPETATAVAARRVGADDCELAAPLGLTDLLQLVLRPGPRFTGRKRSVYVERVRSNGWRTTWPLLREAVEGADDA